jgi:hypothetical protein
MNSNHLSGAQNFQYPYGYAQQPGMFVPMTLDQQIEYRNRIMQEQDNRIEKNLKEKLPTKFLKFYSISMFLIGIVEIVLQIVCFIKATPMSFIANGIWGCLFMILIGAFVIWLGFSNLYLC